MLYNNALLELGSSKSRTLNRAYQSSIVKILNNFSETEIDRLDTYNLIVHDWVSSENHEAYDEFKYRITDGECINEVLFDIVNRDDGISGHTYVNKVLENYIEEDKYKRFLE